MKKKRICRIADIAVPVEHRVKLKESEKREKYLDLARELKKTMEYESDGIVTKRLVQRLEKVDIRERVETI